MRFLNSQSQRGELGPRQAAGMPSISYPCTYGEAKLEETFNQQLEEQERVYGPIGPIILPHDLPELCQENARMNTIGSSTRSSLSSMSEGY